MKPVLNASLGPSLELASTENPKMPRYRTVTPVKIEHGKRAQIFITFLARDADNSFVSIRSYNNDVVMATCSPVLERRDAEVWAARIELSGWVPMGEFVASGMADLYLTQPNGMGVEVQIAISIERGLMASGAGSVLPSYQNVEIAGTGNNSQVEQERPSFTGSRYHSEYVYDRLKPVPVELQEEIRRSLMEISMRGSSVMPEKTAGDVECDIEDGLDGSLQLQPQVRAVTKSQVLSEGFQRPMDASGAQLACSSADEQPGEAQGSARHPGSSLQESVRLEAPAASGAPPAASATSAPPATAPSTSAPAFSVYPGSVLFKACEPGDYQVAKLRIQNLSRAETRVRASVAHRSFATSVGNCAFPQLRPDASAFVLRSAGENVEQMTIVLQPGEQKSIELRFAPDSAEYPLFCAKLLLFAPGQKAFQVPLTGPAGVPEISVLRESDPHEHALRARARNDGTAPAFLRVLGATPELFVIPPGASEAFEAPQDNVKIQAGPDYLRLLYDGAEGKGPWAEMAAALRVDPFQAERALTEAVTEVEVVQE